MMGLVQVWKCFRIIHIHSRNTSKILTSPKVWESHIRRVPIHEKPCTRILNELQDTTHTVGENKTISIRVRAQPFRAIYFKIKILHIHSTNKKCWSTRWLQKLQSCCMYLRSPRLGKFGFSCKINPKNMSFNKQSLLCYWWTNKGNTFSWWYNANDIVNTCIGTITRMWLHSSQGLIEVLKEHTLIRSQIMRDNNCESKLSQMPVVLLPLHFDREPYSTKVWY